MSATTKPNEPAKPRRRWYQYSLRTLLAVVTAICLWLGWQMHGIRQRAEVLQWLEERYAEFDERFFDMPTGNDYVVHHWWMVHDDSELSWHRALLGDHGLKAVVHPIDASVDDVQRVLSAFPEAEILVWPDWSSRNAHTAVVHMPSADFLVTNGTAYDRATLDLGKNEVVMVPAKTEVEYSERPGFATVFMVKTMTYMGHPPTEITIDEVRKEKGFAYRVADGKVQIAKYGEFGCGEGGNSIKLRIRVPAGTRVETIEGELEMPSGRDVASSPLKLHHDRKASWCALEDSAQRWTPEPGKPDTESFVQAQEKQEEAVGK